MLQRVCAVVIAVLALAPATVPAQAQPAAPTRAPRPLYSTAADFDSARGRMVPLGDTWEWNGSAWTRAATTGPAGRTLQAMAYDPSVKKVVLFGGTGRAHGGDLAARRRLDASDSSEVTPGPATAPRPATLCRG
jgi:hypothetical protein